MNPAETAAIVERIVATWPTGPRGFVWTEAIIALDDAERARAVYERLTITDDRPPSVARFVQLYASTHRRDSDVPQPVDTGEPMSLADYLDAHRDDAAAAAIERTRARHPASPTRRVLR